MLSRRHLLQTAVLGLASLTVPGRLLATAGNRLGWQEFLGRLQALAGRHAGGEIAGDTLASSGTALIQRLDVQAPGFEGAVDSAWESGNRFWLWQRLVRETGLLGGILTIEQGHPVPLHDHPGATGILRILSGTAEVWQFDRIADDGEYSRLQRVSRRLLKPGDTASLLPARGNIHALKCHSAECRMLDCFIPPYEKRQRSWYLPVSSDWSEPEHITCQRVPEQAFYTS